MFIKNLLEPNDLIFNADTSIDYRIYYNSLTTNNAVSIDIKLDGKFNVFQSGVGIDDIASDYTKADFYVYADGKLVDAVKAVNKHNSNQRINVNIYGANILTLKIVTKRSNNLQASWIEPEVHVDLNKNIICPVNIISCDLPILPIRSKYCFATVLTNGMDKYFDEMMSSFIKHNDVDNIVVFGFDLDSQSLSVVKKYNVKLINCYINGIVMNTAYKIILMSIPYIILADKYIYIDCDCLICDNLTHLFDMLDDLDDYPVLAVRHGDKDRYNTLEEAMLGEDNFAATIEEMDYLGLSPSEKIFDGVINTGFFVASDCALFRLNHAIQTFMPMINVWMSKKTKYNVREEGVIISALARTNGIVLLDESYNIQMHFYFDSIPDEIKKIGSDVYFGDSKVHILHFTGLSKPNKYYSALSILK
jgi:hypothetical protein